MMRAGPRDVAATAPLQRSPEQRVLALEFRAFVAARPQVKTGRAWPGGMKAAML
jgi:hypothetical protein